MILSSSDAASPGLVAMSLYTAVSLGSSTANSMEQIHHIHHNFPPKPVGLRAFSKNDILPACRKRCAHPLGPLCEGDSPQRGRCRKATEGPEPEVQARPQACGRELYDCPKYSGLWQGSSLRLLGTSSQEVRSDTWSALPRESAPAFCSLISPPQSSTFRRM